MNLLDSKTAYTAMVYLSIKTDVSQDIKFVCCKIRVMLLKEHTIPRLDFLSALLLSKLLRALEPELKLGQQKMLKNPLLVVD